LNSKLRLYFNERSIPFIGSIEKEFESENFQNSGNYDLDSFEEIAEFLVNKLIPLSYTKLYERYRSLGINKFPTSPKKLFTSLAYFQDDIFKIYAAEKKKQGSIFCIFQHGGNFGTTPFAFLEEHQIKSSTYWYSWGWKSEKFDNVIPVGNLRTKKTMREKSFFGSSRNKLLIVCMSLPRYSYCLYPVPLGPQYIQYLDFLGNFYNSLSLETQKKSIVRLHRGDFGWNQDKRWRRISKDVVFDKNSNIYKSVFSSKIVVVTYNATTLIEMFFWNVPMILLLDEKYWELNEESKIVYDKLKKYSIFQTSPKECADFIDSIWDDVDTWWYSPEVQKSRKAFLEIYSKHGDFKKL